MRTMPDRVVVYAGNRRYYHNLVAACKSLLFHTRVDRVYFLIEDDEYPDYLPNIVRCINVSGQKIFQMNGPNMHSYYSYMTTLRAGLTKLLPNEDLVLWLDPDTVVYEDISGIWNYDVSSYYFAAVQETRNNDHEKHPYYNAGVMLMDLRAMRQDGVDDRIINEINTKHYKHLEQDVLNYLCDGKILDLPCEYNSSFVSDHCMSPKVIHFLDRSKSYLPQAQSQYSRFTWEECMHHGVSVAGMKRYDIINRFIQERNYQSYLEIGVENGDAFDKISVPVKVSVDPDPRCKATHQVTSDEFFATNKQSFDVVFVDGLHEAHQVDRDIHNAVKALNKNGVILLHDCLPTSELMQEPHGNSQYGYAWTGDVWKAFVKARSKLPYHTFTLDTDFGIGVIDTAVSDKPQTDLPNDINTMTYDQFVKNRNEWMNVKTVLDTSILA